MHLISILIDSNIQNGDLILVLFLHFDARVEISLIKMKNNVLFFLDCVVETPINRKVTVLNCTGLIRLSNPGKGYLQ